MACAGWVSLTATGSSLGAQFCTGSVLSPHHRAKDFISIHYLQHYCPVAPQLRSQELAHIRHLPRFHPGCPGIECVRRSAPPARRSCSSVLELGRRGGGHDNAAGNGDTGLPARALRVWTLDQRDGLAEWRRIYTRITAEHLWPDWYVSFGYRKNFC